MRLTLNKVSTNCSLMQFKIRDIQMPWTMLCTKPTNTCTGAVEREQQSKKSMMHSFLLQQASLGKSFVPQVELFSTLPSLLNISATALICIFSLVLNGIKANKKNSIIKGWKYWSRKLLRACLFFNRETI